MLKLTEPSPRACAEISLAVMRQDLTVAVVCDALVL